MSQVENWIALSGLPESVCPKCLQEMGYNGVGISAGHYECRNPECPETAPHPRENRVWVCSLVEAYLTQGVYRMVEPKSRAKRKPGLRLEFRS
jgi:hypothetical protein